MRKILVALVLATGCVSGGPGADTERVLAIQLPFDSRNLEAGDWVMYTVKTRGIPRSEHVKWSVVEGTGRVPDPDGPVSGPA